METETTKVRYIILPDGPHTCNAFVEPLPKAAKCRICGGSAYIDGINDGIGDIRCSECGITYSGCHYSGRYRTTKKQAIRCWNEVQNGD